MHGEFTCCSTFFATCVIGCYVCYNIALFFASSQSPHLAYAITNSHTHALHRIAPLEALSSTHLRQPPHRAHNSYATWNDQSDANTKNIDNALGFSWDAMVRTIALRGVAVWHILCGLALFGSLRIGKKASYISLASTTARKAPSKEFGYTAVALDLDGTLLGEDQRISEKSKEVLRALSKEGLQIILATGRSLPACYEPVQALQLDKPLPVVCYNGACGVIFHPGVQQPEVLYEKPVPRPQREKLLQLAEQNGALVQYYHDENIYVQCQNEEHFDLIRRYAELAGVGHTQIQSYNEVLHLDPCKMLIMTDEPDTIVAAGRQCFADGSLNVVRGTPPFFVEFLHPDVCKGVGFAQMCQVLGQPLEKVIAFGDGDNDMEMLQMAGKGFAMRNARDEVRSCAEYVTELTNKEDGVVMELLKLKEDGLLLPAEDTQVSTHIAMFSVGGEKDEPKEDTPTLGNEVQQIPPPPLPEPFIESPFTFTKVASTMALWSLSLALVGIIILPLSCALLGIPLLQLSAFDMAKYFAALQATETLVAYAVFSWALEPYQPLPSGWFVYNRQGPFGRRGWLTWTIVGTLMAPLAVIVGSVLNEVVGQTGMSATVEEVSKLVGESGSNSMSVLLLMSTITSVLAPLMEEGVFRGFLLTSLTKWMPVGGAVVVSSACFAAAHLSAHDFLPLFLLGNVLGFTYVQTKDLLAPTLVHCLWNLFVLYILAVSTQMSGMA